MGLKKCGIKTVSCLSNIETETIFIAVNMYWLIKPEEQKEHNSVTIIFWEQ